MNKTVLLIVIALIILIGGWFLFSTKETNSDVILNNETSTEEPELSDETSTESSTEGVMQKDEDAIVSPGHTVTYTDNGYAPQTLEIKIGDSVTFVNDSTRGMWTASALHPTHTLYPEKSDTDCFGSSFDACKALDHGEEWTFTFTHVGEWKYHNHVNARDTGTVIVK